MADSWAPGLLKHPQDLLQWSTVEEHLPICWELWGAKEPPSNMVPPESNIWVDLWHVLPETWTELEELMQEEETHNLPETAKDGWRHLTWGPQRQWRFQGVIMLALHGMRGCQQIHLWKASKVKNHFSHLREEMPLWKHLILGQIIGLHIEVGRNVCWNKSNTMLVGRTQYLTGQPGKKRRHCTTLITQISLSNAVIQMQANHLTR